MSRSVDVIVSQCRWNAQANSWQTWDRLISVRFESVEEARTFGDQKRGHGLAVTVRPNYNESAPGQSWVFREWRSFDGRPFEEIRFDVEGWCHERLPEERP